MSVVLFRPRASLRAEERAAAFIDLARNRLTGVLVPDAAYNAPSWDVTASFTVKGAKGERWLHFLEAGAVARKGRTSSTGGAPLRAPFLAFAQASIRYRHAAAPVSYGTTHSRLQTLRRVEAAFRSLGREPEIWTLDPAVLDQALRLGAGESDQERYKIGNQLECLLQSCRGLSLLASDVSWKCQVPKPHQVASRLGDEFAERRAKRLPSAAAFEALAHIFRHPQTEADRLLSAVAAVCCGVPIRAHEVLQLGSDCEVEAEALERPGEAGGRSVDGPASHKAYGLRVHAGKGNVPQVKWVPETFSDVMREAVGRLRVACAPARSLAAWYEMKPQRLWLPERLEHLRGVDWLLVAEVQVILGLPTSNAAALWLDNNGVAKRLGERRGGNGKRLVEVRFSDVERAVVALLPGDFPHPNNLAGQRYSETLAVVRLNGLHTDRATIACMFEPVGYGQFWTWLRGSSTRPSVFARHGFTERDGRPIQIGTHAFRHWLNTIAQKRDLGELEIAKWSGRHPDQNHFYDHETSAEILRELRGVVDDDSRGHGPLFDAAAGARPHRRQPISRKDFKETLFGSGHITDAGICVHDYSLLPCQYHGNCLGCAENVFVKGDEKHRTKIEARLAATLDQLAQARAAMAEATYGADRWVRAHERNVAQMRRMLAIHADPSIRDGDLVSLHAQGQDSEIQMALRDRDASAAGDRPSPSHVEDGGPALPDEIADVFE